MMNYNLGGSAYAPSVNKGISNLTSMTQAATTTATGSALSSEVNLPSWLTTNPDSLQKELSASYQSAPAGILSAADKAGNLANQSADMAYGQQLRQGQNATRQLSNVSRQQGGTAKTSSIVAGQMAEDAGKQRTDARVQIAQMKLGATEQAASLSTQIASGLANLRTSYLGTLAGTNTAMRGQNISLAENMAELGARYMPASPQATPAANSTPTPTMTYTGQRGQGLGTYTGPTGFNTNLYPGVGSW